MMRACWPWDEQFLVPEARRYRFRARALSAPTIGLATICCSQATSARVPLPLGRDWTRPLTQRLTGPLQQIPTFLAAYVA
jgi:hypothetical protein